jgi:hypothetical protein
MGRDILQIGCTRAEPAQKNSPPERTVGAFEADLYRPVSNSTGGLQKNP